MTFSLAIIIISVIAVIGAPVGLGLALIGRNYRHEEMAGLVES